MIDSKMFAELRLPFHPSQVSWKAGAVKGERAMAMPYADLRAYMNRLDEVCGDAWEVAYEPWGSERIICKLTIAGVTRCSTGEMGAQDEKNEIGGTVAEAQALKRAAAMFGLGRYLYNLPSGWADYDPATKKFTEKAKAKLIQMLVQHYRRATEGNAEMTEVSPERRVDASTGEIVDSLPVTTDVIFQAEEPVSKMSDEQRKKLNAIGHDLYADEWDIWRHKHAEIISKGRTMSSNNLTRQETSDLIDKLTTLTTFEMLGQELYGEQWEAVCQRNAKRVSAGQVEDSDSLTTQQLQTLIDGMMTVKTKRAQQPIAQVA